MTNEIDTTKYDGHLLNGDGQAWCYSKWLLNTAETTAEMSATANLLNDASMLLEEVKQFHAFDEYITMLRNGQIDADDICDVWDEIRKGE